MSPLLFLCLILITPAFGQQADFSLMLNSAEQTQLDEALSSIKDEGNDHDVHLSAILYFSPHKWTLWINGRPFHSDPPHLIIKSIQPDYLTFSFREAPNEEITLSPNQSYLYQQKQIIEKADQKADFPDKSVAEKTSSKQES